MKKTVAVIMALSMLFLCGCSIDIDLKTIEKKAEQIINDLENSGDGSFTFTKVNYPEVGVTMATSPLGTSYTASALGVSSASAENTIAFNGTVADCYKALCDETLDIIFAYAPDKDTKAYAKEKGVEFEMTAICLDALVFVCPSESVVDDITTEQIKDIYSGKITSWKDMGEDTKIVPYQKIKGSDSRRLFDDFIKPGDKLAKAPTVKRNDSGVISEAIADYNNCEGALGYTVYHYLNNIEKEKLSTLKMLSVDGVTPKNSTISDGRYPLTSEIYVVIKTSAEKDSPERILYNWICSAQGSELAKKENYPIKTTS